MPAVLKGQVYWADLDPVRGHEQAGHRPVLVLTNDEFNTRRDLVIAVPITSRPQRASHSDVLPIPGLPRRSWILVSQIRVLSTERLGELIAQASERTLQDVRDALMRLLA